MRPLIMEILSTYQIFLVNTPLIITFGYCNFGLFIFTRQLYLLHSLRSSFFHLIYRKSMLFDRTSQSLEIPKIIQVNILCDAA
jgi:hypothetical protein